MEAHRQWAAYVNFRATLVKWGQAKLIRGYGFDLASGLAAVVRTALPAVALLVNNRMSTRRLTSSLAPGADSDAVWPNGLPAPKPIVNIRMTGTFFLSAR